MSHGALGGPCRDAGSFTGLIPGSRGCQVPQAAAECPAPDGDRGRGCRDPGGARPDLPHHLLQAPHPHRGPPAGRVPRPPVPVPIGIPRRAKPPLQLRPKPADYTLEKKYRLGISLFERMINNKIPHVQLLCQVSQTLPLPPTLCRGDCHHGSSLRRVPGSTACARRSPSCSSPFSTRR